MLINIHEMFTTANSAILPPDVGEYQQISSLKPCNAGIKIDADGSVYTKSNNGVWQVVATWLLVGPNTAWWVSRTIDSGTLTTDAGAGPLVCSSDREYSIANVILSSTKTVTLTLELSNSDTGSPVISAVQYLIEAQLL